MREHKTYEVVNEISTRNIVIIKVQLIAYKDDEMTTTIQISYVCLGTIHHLNAARFFKMWILLQYVNCMTGARVTELTVTELTNRLVFRKNRQTRNQIISMMFATKTGLYHIHKRNIRLH